MCVLTVIGRNEALRQWDVALAFRATGINPLPVEKLADAVADHLQATRASGPGRGTAGLSWLPRPSRCQAG